MTIDPFLILWCILFIYMNCRFAYSVYIQRNDVADIARGIWYIILARISLYIFQNIELRSVIVCIMITIRWWRLARHIYQRNINKSEDYRYQAWRISWWKYFYIRSYLQIYILQGIFLYIIISPVLLIHRYTNWNFGLLDIIGIAVWCIGFLFETIGDTQLAHFIKNPINKGKIMTQWLWRYTRHPNYFGEVVQWRGIWIIALSVSYGWIGMIWPLTITFLILFVSGIPLLEKKYAGRDDFEQYKKETSIFFPLPPKTYDIHNRV